MDISNVVLTGRLTADPEVRELGGDREVAEIRLAFSQRVQRNGEWTDKANFIDVSFFGNQAQNVKRNLTKGRRIGVEGTLTFDEWQAQDGTRRSKHKVIARNFYFMDPKPTGNTESQPQDDDIPL